MATERECPLSKANGASGVCLGVSFGVSSNRFLAVFFVITQGADAQLTSNSGILSVWVELLGGLWIRRVLVRSQEGQLDVSI